MRLTCSVFAALAFLSLSTPLTAQDTTGTITGIVTDAVTQQPLASVTVRIEGTSRQTMTGADGSFQLSLVPVGTHRLRALRIGYAQLQQDVTVTSGQVSRVQFAMEPQAALIDPVVVTGYGTQRREAITGSVATIEPDVANVGVVSNVNNMIQGRAAGVNIIQNNGEPGAGAQIRIRGGTSISASNEPLYVVDGIPITNANVEAAGIGIDGTPPLPRSPLNLLNPGDIASITILKDASATAIYGSRGANGVVLIETKKGTSGTGASTIELDSYVSSSSPSRRLGLVSGQEFRTLVADELADAIAENDTLTRNLWQSVQAGLGTANTDWERAVTRSAPTTNHNLAFAGGTDVTRYRASLNYMDQQGVALGSGFRRVQGRISGTHAAWDNRLRLGVNVTSSRINNDYLSFENTGGFEGGVFVNMAIYNPTQPIQVTDSAGVTRYYESGTGALSIRNPVALADQIIDLGSSNRTLGNATAAFDLVPGLTASVNVGVDQSNGVRRTYLPAANPVGAQTQGRARMVNRENSSLTFQGQLSFNRQFGDQTLDIVGVYEFAEHTTQEFGAEARNFTTDLFSFYNLGSGGQLVSPFSFRNDERWISFLSRANWGLRDKFFVTGVIRYDGRSAFAEGHKWALFPGISASWRLTDEGFMQNAPLGLSDLKIRAGWGMVGNPGVPPYSSLVALESTPGSRYAFGDEAIVGFGPTRNPNPNLKFEKTSQINVAVDYGMMNNRLSGSIEYYIKNTTDLLVEVDVPQPAFASRRLENVGRVRNRGLELALDWLAMSRPGMTWRAGLVLAAERGTVLDLGPYSLIGSGGISGEGQTGANSQRIIPGEPLGTFYGPVYAGVDTEGRQLVQCASQGASDTLCVGGVMLATQRRASDFRVLGNANPDLTLGVHSQLTWGKFDASVMIRGAFGQEVFNNTALVYGTKTKARAGRNFLASALDDPIAIGEPAIFSSKWIEDGTFLRLQNITIGYTLEFPRGMGAMRTARVYVSGDNLLLLTGYSGLDPEAHAESGLAARGIDYLSYPRPRTVTAGVRVAF